MNSFFNAENPVLLFLLMGTFSLLPFAVVCFTCFVKMQIVFGLLRLGLGAQQIPSGFVTTTLAFILSTIIMTPVTQEMRRDAMPLIAEIQETKTKLSLRDAGESLQKVASALSTPLQKFLLKHSKLRERIFFAQVSLPEPAPTISAEEAERFSHTVLPQEDLFSLSAAFLLSELQRGFLFGLLLILPFLIVDIVVSNILVGLGMSMVSPTTIALPLKILLFVTTDSWFLLVKALLRGYQ